MIKLLMTTTVFLFLFGCSNEETVVENLSEAKPLEEKIADVMEEQDYLLDNIVDYEINDDFIYVFSYTTQSGLSAAILKFNSNSIDWVMGEKSIQTISIGDPEESTPILTVVQTDEPNVKGVRVNNEHAKLIQLTQDLTEDYSTEVKYWIHFSKMTEDFENLENIPSENIEFIRQNG
ncbi:hypothetical protein GH741_02060 [Aquibacillus halophilus]|uniref:Lipoprotein n=1 Tax=Aquibacillus halophilus TaxID=930132 RepID=A0A6A8D6S0_9BACI|nr:hypothetical protein [Aquibacillus halophilus]MRH41455.1 hypothetical protein [Aquibacillus halophilus]